MPIQLTPEQLLDIARGTADMVELTKEQEIEQAKEHWKVLPEDKREKILHRRRLRSAMFKILKYEARNMVEEKMTVPLYALKEIIDEQLDPNLQMNWLGFTFVWDIHPTGVPKIVRKEFWIREGGQFDAELGSHFPSAFTEQVID